MENIFRHKEDSGWISQIGWNVWWKYTKYREQNICSNAFFNFQWCASLTDRVKIVWNITLASFLRWVNGKHFPSHGLDNYYYQQIWYNVFMIIVLEIRIISYLIYLIGTKESLNNQSLRFIPFPFHKQRVVVAMISSPCLRYLFRAVPATHLHTPLFLYSIIFEWFFSLVKLACTLKFYHGIMQRALIVHEDGFMKQLGKS